MPQSLGDVVEAISEMRASDGHGLVLLGDSNRLLCKSGCLHKLNGCN